ncbi:MAG: hypothetical protein Q9227_000750 [Pyrenula ochraceoflavens]
MDDEAIDRFDHSFFQIAPSEAMCIDPQQRLLLELAYEAIEGAGIPLDDFMGTATAVFTGMEGCDYHTVLARDIDATPRYLATGTPTCMSANRLSYFFNLSGASIAVDSACSSSMSALHQAVSALQRNEASMALVCGAKLIINPDMFVSNSELNFLGASGKCNTFDASADGYGRGEGALAFLLKPLERAIMDHDPIRAVIRGTSLNQDGRTQGITLPSCDAQAKNMQTIYGKLSIRPSDIQYVEAHRSPFIEGTGTAAGDPLETSAISSVYMKKEHKVIIGSVKSSIGHLESASALASIMKTILCLEHGQIPPQLHFNKANPKIDYSHLEIPDCVTEWPETDDGIRRAAINSFGAGGTNGHAVLESFTWKETNTSKEPRNMLFKISGSNDAAVRRLCNKYVDFVQSQKPSLLDLAYSSLRRRSTLLKTRFVVAKDHDELVRKLQEPSATSTKNTQCPSAIIYIFTGQAAQWPQMGRELIRSSFVFRDTVNKCQAVLSSLADAPSWSVFDELYASADSSHVFNSAYSQPLCTIIQVALIEQWRFWGLKPDASVGHSSGEIASAYAAGILSLRAAVIVAYYRGLYLSKLTPNNGAPKGSMCAIGLSEGECLPLVEKAEDIAFELVQLIADLTQTVRFSPALNACLQSYQGSLALVEVGPHPALKSPVLDVLKAQSRDSAQYFYSIFRSKDDSQTMLETAGGMLVSGGIRLNSARINAEVLPDGTVASGNLILDLPTYQWDHSTPLWYETSVSKAIRHKKFRRHLLLGSRYVDDIPGRPSWRNNISLRELPWLAQIKARKFSGCLKSTLTLV